MARTKRDCPSCKRIKRPVIQQIHASSAQTCILCYRERVGRPSQAREPSVCGEVDPATGLVCGRTKSYTAKTCQRCWYTRALRVAPPPEPVAPSAPPLKNYDDGYRRWKDCIGKTKEYYRGPLVRPHKGDRTRVLILPDLHVPFHDPVMLSEVLRREKKQTDICFQTGDLSDQYSTSRWPREHDLTFAEEWAQVELVLDELSASFPETRLIIGNHDQRLRRALLRSLSPPMLEAIQSMTDGSGLCVLSALVKRYKNVQVVDHQVPHSDIRLDWLSTIGDVVVAHPERQPGKVPGRASTNFREWLDDHETDLHLGDTSLYIIGHTHNMSMVPWRGRTRQAKSLLIEAGCLCQPQPYQFSPLAIGKGQLRGYLTFSMYANKVDLNSVKMTCFDFEEGPWSTS